MSLVPQNVIEGLVADVVDGEPAECQIRLFAREHDELGPVLDGVTERLTERGYRLQKVRVETDDWIASYRRAPLD